MAVCSTIEKKDMNISHSEIEQKKMESSHIIWQKSFAGGKVPNK